MTTLLLSVWTVSVGFVSGQMTASLEHEVPFRGSRRPDVVRERVLSEWLLYGGLAL